MTDPMISPTPTSAVPAKTSAWEDVLDIFYSPRQVFERRRDGKYLIALVVLCLLTVVVYFLSLQMNEALQEVEMARTFRERGFTPEQMAQAKSGAAKFSGLIVYFLPIFVAIGSWISGGIITLLGKMMGGKFTFAQGTAIAVLASMPELLGRVLVGVQSLLIDTSTAAHRYSFSFNASRFLPGGTNNWLLKLGALADPFVIWGIVLIGVGAFVIGRMEKEKAAVLAIVVALVGTALFR
ncbi:MAG: YIP1 family protein [Gemmatimonadaceae bacterium]|nr:YIP1 family protein [Gemmatimonadaceae bacterium]